VYSVDITKPAEKRLRKFSKVAQRAFAAKIDKIRTDPKFFLKPLSSNRAGEWEYYFEGSFRIIFRIEENEKKLVIEAIRHKDEF
jgi:mRNA-degrading endonuclease RelE of RelBE toxin-antitoxin system